MAEEQSEEFKHGLSIADQCSRDVLPSHNLEADYGELVNKGAAFETPPEKQPWGTEAVFHDPDGNSAAMQIVKYVIFAAARTGTGQRERSIRNASLTTTTRPKRVKAIVARGGKICLLKIQAGASWSTSPQKMKVNISATGVAVRASPAGRQNGRGSIRGPDSRAARTPQMIENQKAEQRS